MLNDKFGKIVKKGKRPMFTTHMYLYLIMFSNTLNHKTESNLDILNLKKLS